MGYYAMLRRDKNHTIFHYMDGWNWRISYLIKSVRVKGQTENCLFHTWIFKIVSFLDLSHIFAQDFFLLLYGLTFAYSLSLPQLSPHRAIFLLIHKLYTPEFFPQRQVVNLRTWAEVRTDFPFHVKSKGHISSKTRLVRTNY